MSQYLLYEGLKMTVAFGRKALFLLPDTGTVFLSFGADIMYH